MWNFNHGVAEKDADGEVAESSEHFGRCIAASRDRANPADDCGGKNSGGPFDAEPPFVVETGSGQRVRDPESILDAAEKVYGILERHRVGAVVIGAVALAAYNYVRNTEDLDFGVNANLEELRSLARSLAEEGFSVELHEPDLNDPLGGVIDVSGSFGLLQIVSFAGRFPAVIDDALRASNLLIREGSPLKLVPIAHLIALKLYAAGHKSKADIVELLRRNPDLDLEPVRELCRRYRLRGLEDLIEEAYPA